MPKPTSDTSSSVFPSGRQFTAGPTAPQTREPYLTATPGASPPGDIEQGREPHELDDVQGEHRHRHGLLETAVVQGDVEVHRGEIPHEEQPREDDQSKRERGSESLDVRAVDVQQATKYRDAGGGKGEVNHPQGSNGHATGVRLRWAPYLLFPQPRFHPSPDFEEILEMDLEARGEGV